MKTTARQRRTIGAAVRPRLVAMFPFCFAASGEPKRPIKIGIRQDIMARTDAFTSLELYCGLGHYTNKPSYLRAMIEGADRIDIDGNPAGVVSAADEEHAKAGLRRFERWAAKDRKRQIEAARQNEAAAE